MHIIAKPAALLGRALLSLLFILAGLGKIMNPASTDQMIQSNTYFAAFERVPMGIGVGIFELVAGLAILIGFFTRLTSLILAGFCIATALFFHNQLGDQLQMAMFLKNLAIAGGFLTLFAYGNIAYGFDSVREKRRVERERHQVELAEARRKETIT